MKKLAISFCTTCMNRASHVERTLLQNILHNEDYEPLEFVVLDYNSNDGLEALISSTFSHHITRGRLKYYRTTDPTRYSMPHSRNAAFKLATGEVICNIDADNFTGAGFAEYINERFQKNGSIFLTTQSGESKIKNDVLGRVCVKKSDFMAINGYDERMIYYGFEDYDLTNRLQLYGLTKTVITEQRFLGALKHSDETRLENTFSHQDLHAIFIRYELPWQSKVFLLLQDRTSFSATIVNNVTYESTSNRPAPIDRDRFKFSILEPTWTRGTWNLENGRYEVATPNSRMTLTNRNLDTYISVVDESKYYKVSSKKLRDEVIFFFHQMYNRVIMDENLNNSRVQVNQNGFGKISLASTLT
ncbi:glycosyltransferase [Pedobacter deserti]|uniref:glycosyltransferase n=1 Tax=Pedobacter deserti TaxID=2817382 RepID=UPI00210A168C|nr:glycosyltransferase family A protein [Pedobacter sp. SYSU D00382]